MTVTTTFFRLEENQFTGQVTRRTKITVTGLSASTPSTIAHGLPATPFDVPNYQATSGTPGFETSPPDATNVYYTTGAGQTSLRIALKY